MKALVPKLHLSQLRRESCSRSVQLFVITLTIFASAISQAIPQRSYEQAWSAIMSDLETMIRSQAEHGPYIDTTPEEMGYGENDHIFEAIRSARQHPEYRNSQALNQYEDQRKVLGWQSNLVDAYRYRRDSNQKKIPQKERNQILMAQFQRSFQREVLSLSTPEAGKLMAHFAASVPLRGPSFMSPLVYFAWSSQSEVSREIHKMAQEMIWDTGNLEGIRAFVPHLLTNRTATFADSDQTQIYLDPKHEVLPSSQLEFWQERFPDETRQALQDFEWAAIWGDLRKPRFFNLPEFRGFWSATAVQEIHMMLEYKKKKGLYHSKPSGVSCHRAHGS